MNDGMAKGARMSETHVFSYDGHRVLYRVDDGEFFEISEMVSDLLSLPPAASREYRIAELSGSYDLDEILAAIEELEEVDILSFGPQAATELMADVQPTEEDAPSAPLPISMTLHISHACNISCSYCFALGGSYGGKPDLMDLETAKASVHWLFGQSGPGGSCQVEFFGGEPLLNFPLMKALVPYARKLAKELDIRVEFAMTTNGTLLQGNIMEFVMAEDIGMLISIDGAAGDHDTTRTFHDGAPTHEVIEQNVREATARRPDLVDLRATMTSQNLDIGGIADSLAQYGPSRVGVAPVHQHPASPTSIRDEHLPEMKGYLRKLSRTELNVILSGETAPHSYFRGMIKTLLNGRKRSYGCGGGKTFFGVSVDGSIFFCSSFASMTEFKMGDVFSGLDPEKKARFDGELLVDRREPCRSCWARNVCGGGCIYESQAVNGNYQEPNPVFCERVRYSYEQAMGMCLEIQEECPEALEALCEAD